MKIFFLIIFSFFLFSTYGQQPVTPQNDNSKYSFQLGDVLFQVDGNHGARIDSYTLDGTEFLYVEHNSGVEDMYGSTCWISPQSLWGWPPQPAVDLNSYTGGISGEKVILTSALATAGNVNFQIEKTFTADLQDSSVSIDYTIINRSTAARSFASWEIMRVPTGGLTFFPINGTVTGALAPAFTIQDNIAWWDYDSTKAIFNKAFADGSGGWLAHIDNNRLIHIKKFEDAASNFPGNGEKEVEFWANDQMFYNEIEKHSEYTAVQINDSTKLSVKWFLRKLPENIKVNAGNQEIVQYVNSIVNPVITQVNETFLNNQAFDIYPNPTNGRITFYNHDSNERILFTLYDILGNLCVRKIVSSGEVIDLQNLQNGIYICSMESSVKRCLNKLIIKK